MARLVSVTVKERGTNVYDTALTAAIAGRNIQYVQDKSGDAEIQLINKDSVQTDILLVDETFAAITTAINVATVSNSQNVVDVDVDSIDDKVHSTALNRLMEIDEIIFAEEDPNDPSSKTRVEYYNAQRVRKEIWIIDVAIATFITACNQ